ncbi:MAG: fatty acid desaturase, partial [Pseudomonadota bacterium]
AFGRQEVIGKKQLKPYMARKDGPGLVFFFGHMAALGLTGFGVHLALGSWWIVPAIFLHGFVMAFLFAPVHECSHGTVFRTRWLNEAVYWVVCLIYLVPPTFFRYAHATHHTYTQVRGWDPDMMPERMNLWHYIKLTLGIPFWTRNFLWFVMHPFGRIHPDQRYYLPEGEIPKAVREARIILLLYGGVAIISLYLGTWALLLYWIIPRLVGEPFMRWLRFAEHGECDEGPDLRHNTRTTSAPPWLHFLFWNMSYHAEHHLCPMVPFHALPKLHSEIGGQLHPVGEGYFSVHHDLLGKITRHQGVTWKEPVSVAE